VVGSEKPASQGAGFRVRPDGGSPGSLFRAMRVLSVSSRGISEDATRAIWRCRSAGGLETVAGTQRRRLRARCRGRLWLIAYAYSEWSSEPTYTTPLATAREAREPSSDLCLPWPP